jgi:predicted nucleotidyltransferase
MKAVGVIVEYNPFHNGHAFHLSEAKKSTGADVVIAVMSGNFLQRGEPALVSKWTRAKMAIYAGVDLVFELPYQFATQQAEIFASGAVSLLAAAGCEAICFGSESGNIHDFENTVQFIEKHDSFFQQQVRIHLSNGVSYPRALSLAFFDLDPDTTVIDLSKPNNILGYHYIKAIQKEERSIQPLTIQRKNASYHDEQLPIETIASATSIRKALFKEKQSLDDIKPYVPDTTFNLLHDYQQKYGGFHSWEKYWPFLKFTLLQSSPSQLREIYEVEEGIENRLQAMVMQADSFYDFMTRIKTKRYTWTRLQRICLHILMNAQKTEMKKVDNEASYLRLLGMSTKGREYLNLYKHHLSLPLISKLSSYKGTDISLDIRAAKIYSLGLDPKNTENLIDEFREIPFFHQQKEGN